MFHIHPRTLLKAALLPTALLMAAGGSQAAFASQAAPTAHVTSGKRSTPSPDSYYTMRLSPSSVTVRAGYRTRITVSFHATTDLYSTKVALSVSGLPGGVTASFSPRTATIGGRSVLTLTAASSSAAGPFAVTVTAITLSSDPIGTSAPLSLTISTPRLFSHLRILAGHRGAMPQPGRTRYEVRTTAMPARVGTITSAP
jgi:hypothetical protein